MPIDDESYDLDPNPLATAIMAIVDDRMEKFYTSLPAYVVDYDHVRQSVEVQPWIEMPWREEDGETGSRKLPMVLDVPVLFPGGGKNRITWPIEKGDTVLLLCLSQDDTKWKTQGREVDTGKSFGRHHIQYAMALPAGHSLAGPARPKTDAPTDAMVLHVGPGKSVKLVASTASEIVAINSELAALTAKYNDLVAKFNAHGHTYALPAATAGTGPTTGADGRPTGVVVSSAAAAAAPVGSPRVRVP